MKQFDYLVLGSGIAGLSFALKVAPHGRVAIITKKNRAESNTNYAQGGIAAVTSKEDSVELHVRDTLEAGAGLCKEEVVRTIIQEGPARIAELIELGMHFSEREIPKTNGARELDLGKEGGHSRRRILHAKDVTGREIERALRWRTWNSFSFIPPACIIPRPNRFLSAKRCAAKGACSKRSMAFRSWMPIIPSNRWRHAIS